MDPLPHIHRLILDRHAHSDARVLPVRPGREAAQRCQGCQAQQYEERARHNVEVGSRGSLEPPPPCRRRCCRLHCAAPHASPAKAAATSPQSAIHFFWFPHGCNSHALRPITSPEHSSLVRPRRLPLLALKRKGFCALLVSLPRQLPGHLRTDGPVLAHRPKAAVGSRTGAPPRLAMAMAGTECGDGRPSGRAASAHPSGRPPAGSLPCRFHAVQ